MEKQKLNLLIGDRLRKIRAEKGLSLDRVAEITGVSKPMLGQIERARSNPTVSTLWKIAEGLNVPFTAFIEEETEDIKVVKKADLIPIKEAGDRYEVFPIFPMNDGKPFEIYEVKLLPGCDYQADPHPPGVEEYLWLSQGTIILSLNENNYPLSAGEGLRFPADQTHRYRNQGSEQANLVMVIYYPHHPA